MNYDIAASVDIFIKKYILGIKNFTLEEYLQLGLMFISAAKSQYSFYEYIETSPVLEMYFNNLPKSECYIKAVEMFEAAAEADHAEALFQLGFLHENGLGVEQDICKAVEFYESAVKLNHPEAMYYLGCICETRGQIKKAYELYVEAAKLGNSNALLKLEMEYQIISNVGVVKRADCVRVKHLLKRCISSEEKEQCINDLYKYDFIFDVENNNFITISSLEIPRTTL